MTQVGDASSPPLGAWQPLTFGGVAAFASARLGRVLLVGVLTGAICGGAVVWFLQRDYCPVILQAIQKMPDTARVADGKLQGVPDVLISESKLLAVMVTPETSADLGQGADLMFQLRQTDFCIVSIFRPDWGLEFDYDRGGSLKLSRASLEPWWSAWQPVLLAGSGCATAVVILVLWIIISAVCMAPAKFIAWYLDRKLTWSGAWRLCFASLAPGALVLTFGIVLYGWQAIDLVQLSFFYVAHLMMGWIYMTGGVWASPRLFPRMKTQNPFAA